jgi:hypothetical protein
VSTGEQHTQAQERALREYVQRRKALARIPELRDEFWRNLRVVGTGEELNQSLEKANRVRAHRLLLRGRDEERTRACNTEIRPPELTKISKIHAEGATQALEQILSCGLPILYRQAYRLLGNRADAEDAVDDTLLAAYTHRYQFKGQSQMSRARRGSFGSAEFCRDADYSFTYARENRDRNRVCDCLLIRVGNKTKELSCNGVFTFCVLDMPRCAIVKPPGRRFEVPLRAC